MRPELRPVLIRKSAIRPGCPDRDMAVSPQHRLLLTTPEAALLFGQREVLAPALGLINDKTFLRDTSATSVTYHHLMFDRHQILWSDNLISESYLPGRHSVAAMEAPTRAELLHLFPALTSDPNSYGPSARRVLRPREARLLI